MPQDHALREGPLFDVVTQRLQATDHAAVLQLARSMKRWFSPSDLREIEALLAGNASGWIARSAEGSLRGFVLDAPTQDPTVRELAWMAVDAAFQGAGIGSQLLEVLIASYAGTQIREIEVSTVAESAGYAPYEATRHFYHARGFVDRRVDRDYYWPGGDRLVLRRMLPS